MGDTSNVLPEQITRLIGLVIDGVGFTYTVTVNGLPDCVNPEHAPYEGVTKYVAVRCTFTKLVNVPLIVN